MADLTKNYIEQIKADATAITQRRLAEDGVDLHAERNAQVNAMEGVAAASPVREAALANPSDPGLANFQTLEQHQGPVNTHAAADVDPTPSQQASADQATKRGLNTTQSAKSAASNMGGSAK
jgi:hypothetical protein